MTLNTSQIIKENLYYTNHSEKQRQNLLSLPSVCKKAITKPIVGAVIIEIQVLKQISAIYFFKLAFLIMA
jgi:hypothetical protein